MICTKLAKKMLTKKEQKHLTDMGIHNMDTFLLTRIAQIKIIKDNPKAIEPCFDCKHIAQKLGIE